MALDRHRGTARALSLFTFWMIFAATAAANSDSSPYLYQVPSSSLHLEPEFIFHDSELLSRQRRSPDSKDGSASELPLISAKSTNGSILSYTTLQESTTTPALSNATNSPTIVDGQANGKKVVVSTPIVPSKISQASKNETEPVEKKEKIHVWANQTMWLNVTELRNQSQSESFFDDFFDRYPQEVTNQTLAQNNITKSFTDNHQYYKSTFSTNEEVGKRYWVDLDKDPNSQINPLLSRSHRRAATIKLKFDFPFYGHKVRNITIATGGFLYTGDYVHSWLAATQYIAPLMANFDTTLSNDSIVKYADNGTALTVEWRKVQLQDKKNAGPFTFQVTLLSNGDIIFVYAAIPVLVEKIEDDEHPVKVGLSDAYMMDRTIIFARRKTIYEYHRVTFNREDIRNWTAIYLEALPTCLQMDNCYDCLTKIKSPDFECKWCPELQQCSTGTFRFRQEWLLKHCDTKNVKNESSCPVNTSSHKDYYNERAEVQRTGVGPLVTKASSSSQHTPESESHSFDHGVMGILLVMSLLFGLAAWGGYAYRNPHSTSGQMLIRYRPSQWSWRRGEARYTAATIHM